MIVLDEKILILGEVIKKGGFIVVRVVYQNYILCLSEYTCSTGMLSTLLMILKR